ncbi:MAG: PQQ-dependent sugar dehydrogenase [Actinomycetota bacterium]
MRRTMRVLFGSLLVASIAATGPIARASGAPGHRAVIKAVAIKTGLNGPSAFTFAPGGTIWYLERGTGEVHTLDPGSGADQRVFTIGGVDGSGERGALGIALHPNWPAKPQVFVYVTRMHAGHLQNQLVRFTVSGGSGSQLRILLATPASASPYHNGGHILFGPDHNLYVMIGEGHNPANAQDRSGNLRGKILRLDTDGSAAHGNPLGRIWSYGHRNSFGFTFDPKTDRLWETENGPECTDEINLIAKGANFGWGPKETCATAKPRGTNNSGPKPRHLPKAYFASTIGITGAAFCDHCGLGSGVNGDLLFGDVNTGSIRAINMNATRTGFASSPRVLLSAPSSVHSVEVSPGGRIFFSGPTGIYRLVAP